MSRILGKRVPQRLDAKSYEVLRLQVLGRDGWKCQNCGRRDQLQTHHKEFRSHSGDDSEENLITLCADCHEFVHGGRFSPSPVFGLITQRSVVQIHPPQPSERPLA